MIEQKSIHIDPYIEGGNVIYPSFQLSLQQNSITGIHTDVSKIATLMSWFRKQSNTFTHFRDTALYERLTVTEYAHFCLQLFHPSAEKITDLLKQLALFEQKNVKINKLSNGEKQRLAFIPICLNKERIQILEEPFQNMDQFSKQIILQLLHTAQKCDKQIILLSSNLEDLMLSSTYVYRLDTTGLHKLDFKEDDIETNPLTLTHTPIKIHKIPTRKNDKMILFNPPEIDYIESVEGIVSLYVAGEAYPCTLTLNELEQKLTPFGFFRSHRSYIVNLQKVREIITWTRNSYSLALNSNDKTIVPLSKNKLADLKEILGI
ncbi:LytTR family transcriptional regulator DNA-binding domain-containing protein [Lysinibacillus piscis]|uniref:Transcriptional regulator n=1 Tax=Lysinibacillus piscis TaxID=2518931 RepID=A0ABQ5NIB9_9BACI|nr:LytTR family transcriptional regulator DNA-binding domain-containing protein [Lysinibacillus sp. KH24]GLC88110.1 transcriptional regulator [Lysinibacillus sp. KH24]